MDSLTHIALGACVGDAILGRKIGKSAMLIGAIANSIPDFDFIASFFLTTDQDLLAHRGFTHSFLFLILVSPLLAWLSARYSKSRAAFRSWLFFYSIQLFLHIFLDAFNAYGTGWLEPFSHYRVSFNTLFVADPLFSIWMFVAAIILTVLKRSSPRRAFWQKISCFVPLIYLLISVGNKLIVERAVGKQPQVTGRYFTTPTPLNNLLWYVVAETDSGFQVGYRSVFDGPENMDFVFVPRNEGLLTGIRDQEVVSRLKRFSKGYYSLRQAGDSLVFNDLRFGQILGGLDPGEDFVFHYYLGDKFSNEMVVQRGRLAKWNSSTVQLLLKRMAGR